MIMHVDLFLSYFIFYQTPLSHFTQFFHSSIAINANVEWLFWIRVWVFSSLAWLAVSVWDDGILKDVFSNSISLLYGIISPGGGFACLTFYLSASTLFFFFENSLGYKRVISGGRS